MAEQQNTHSVKPRLLDLFCGAGGAAMGYSRGGFDVVGVDIAPQPNYPFEFIQGDVVALVDEWVHPHFRDGRFAFMGWLFDAIHASPPCQAYTSMNNRHGSASPALIADVRAHLVQTGLPYVIENVSGARAELDHPIQVCGRAVGLEIHRHRLFETNWSAMTAPCVGGDDAFGIYGKLDGRRLWTRADGSEYHAAATLAEAQEAMGMPWADWDGVREAIPPAYTEFIGAQLLEHLRRRVAA